MRKSCTVSLLSGFLIAAVTAAGQTTPAAPQTSTTTLPPVGLASTETVQVNVSNTSPVLPSTNSAAAPTACSGSIAFLDSNGNSIGAPTEFKIGSGQTLSAKLPYASAAASGAARIVVRPEILVTLNITTTPPPVTNGTAVPVLPLLLPSCFLTSSVEIYDTATGVTHAFYANSGPQTVPLLRTGQFSASMPAR